MKAGVCCTLPAGQVSPAELRAGEDYLRRAVAYCAVFAPLHAHLARNLIMQERPADALAAAEAMVNCAPMRSEKDRPWVQSVVDGMRVAAEACAKLGQPHVSHSLMARAAARFPDVAPHLEKLHQHGESVALWATLKRFTEAPHKDWVGMRPTAQRLAALHPDNFWAVAHAAMAFTYAPHRMPAEYAVGEVYAQQAIAADPSNPVGYGVLARNLMHQRRADAVMPVLDMLLANCEEESVVKHHYASLDAVRHIFCNNSPHPL
jgi:hypothetical protein